LTSNRAISSGSSASGRNERHGRHQLALLVEHSDQQLDMDPTLAQPSNLDNFLRVEAEAVLVERLMNARHPLHFTVPDGKLTFSKLDAVFKSGNATRDDIPSHLLIGPDITPEVAELYTHMCPAGVYEFVDLDTKPRLQINAQNCVHCKTCDIKDPTQNIVWVAPEGGGGPNYPNM
jgi:ferredoxin-like protein FixX